MENNSKPKSSIPATIVIIGVFAICMAVTVFEPDVLLMISTPTPTAIRSTSIPSTQSFLGLPPDAIDAYDLTQPSLIPPTDTPIPTFTPTVTPTSTPIDGPLPDLTVTGISDPVCTPGHIGTETGNYAKLTIFVRNIGRVSTRSFGPFDVHISLILGQTYYGLDEWASKFNGVAGSSNLEIWNLNPNEDIKLTVVLDLKGSRKFGIEVIANSGANTIPEANTINNKRRQYFSIYCY